MKRGVLHALIIAFFWSLVGQSLLVDTPARSLNSSLDSNQHTFGKSYQFDSPAFSKVLVDFKAELEVEEEEEDDHRYSNNQSFKRLSLPLVVRDVTIRTALFPPKKKIKLFILFHSWKHFLPI